MSKMSQFLKSLQNKGIDTQNLIQGKELSSQILRDINASMMGGSGSGGFSGSGFGGSGGFNPCHSKGGDHNKVHTKYGGSVGGNIGGQGGNIGGGHSKCGHPGNQGGDCNIL